MQVEIITPDETLFTGEAKAVSLPGADGRFQVLNHHAALIAKLVEGTVKIETDEEEKSFEIGGGIIEVLNNRVIILS